MDAEDTIEYRPRPGGALGIRASPLSLLKLQQLPQILLVEGLKLSLLPIDVECIRVCSRSNNYCVSLGEGGVCLSAYAPLLPGLSPAWVRFAGHFESSVKGEPLVEPTIGLERGSVIISGVYRPRVYHLEPLSIRVFRAENLEYRAQAACIEWPSEALMLVDHEPFTLLIEPGRIVSDREVYMVRARRCSRGLIARSLNSLYYSNAEGPVTIRGDVVLLEYTFDGHKLEIVAWNPHTHPVTFEFYTRSHVFRRIIVYTPDDRGEVSITSNRFVLPVKGETVVRLELNLRTLPPLLKPK